MNWNKLITCFLILTILTLCVEAEKKIVNKLKFLTHVELSDFLPSIDQSFFIEDDMDQTSQKVHVAHRNTEK